MKYQEALEELYKYEMAQHSRLPGESSRRAIMYMKSKPYWQYRLGHKGESIYFKLEARYIDTQDLEIDSKRKDWSVENTILSLAEIQAKHWVVSLNENEFKGTEENKNFMRKIAHILGLEINFN